MASRKQTLSIWVQGGMRALESSRPKGTGRAKPSYFSRVCTNIRTNFTLATLNLNSSPKTVTRLQNFLQLYRQRQNRRMKSRDQTVRDAFSRVKVAIIDTGVDESAFDEYTHSCKGTSFVRKDNTESHWWLSSDVHGTQMAKLISSLDPFCQLHIAKVGDHKTDIVSERVVQACGRPCTGMNTIADQKFRL
jgi:hypothetical protein